MSEPPPQLRDCQARIIHQAQEFHRSYLGDWESAPSTRLSEDGTGKIARLLGESHPSRRLPVGGVRLTIEESNGTMILGTVAV